MGRIAYLDCFSGVSGDMLLGAVMHAGVPLDELRAELAKVPLAGYSLEVKPVTKAGHPQVVLGMFADVIHETFQRVVCGIDGPDDFIEGMGGFACGQ